MTHDIYRKLQEQLDQYSLGFPATESGVEIKILKKLFSEDEAELFLLLSLQLETSEEIAGRLRRDPDAVSAQLDQMAEKGLIFRLRKGPVIKYGATAFVAGIFEFQLPTLDRELAELVEQYGEEAFLRSAGEGTSLFMRTVPINRSLDVSYKVAPYEDAREIIKKAKFIAVAKCICRVQQGLIERGCDKPLEVCLLFGSNGRYYLDRGMARQVTVEEALKILDQAQGAGLVTQPAAPQNPAGMCNCCGDCCAVLRALNRLPRPAENVFSNYYAVVDQDLCTGCETCLERCQMAAITVNEDEGAEINLDRCIGCGLCVTTCPGDALRLEPKKEDNRLIPPETAREQMALMAQKRGKSLIPLAFSKT
jgi:electron transport complex protein RnfB